jgi:hypothetical protein
MYIENPKKFSKSLLDLILKVRFQDTNDQYKELHFFLCCFGGTGV